MTVKSANINRTKKGFTLIELLLAVGFLTFALSALLLLLANCMFLNESNRNLTIALSHGQYVLEDIKNENFYDLETNINNGNWDWDTTAIGNQGLVALDAESIDTNEAGTDPDLLNVQITVSWQDRTSRARNVILETLIAEP